MNSYYLAAAALSGLTTALHLFGGGPAVAGPLLRSDMEDVAKYTNYYCWHLVSIVLVAMAAGFYVVASRPAEAALAVLLTVLAAVFSVWSIVLVGWKQQSIWQMPQWLLFLPIAVFGGLGLWLGQGG